MVTLDTTIYSHGEPLHHGIFLLHYGDVVADRIGIEDIRQQQLRDDEELARRLQAEESGGILAFSRCNLSHFSYSGLRFFVPVHERRVIAPEELQERLRVWFSWLAIAVFVSVLFLQGLLEAVPADNRIRPLFERLHDQLAAVWT
jgi:hypothetical protein